MYQNGVEIKYCLGNGKTLVRTFPNVIPCVGKVKVGLDLSHKNTGVFIKNDKGPIAVIEITNTGVSSADYRRMMISILMKTFHQAEVVKVIAEEPYGSSAYSRLKDLEKRLKEFFPETKVVRANIWRKGFLNSDSYTGRFKREDVKSAVAEEALKRFPTLEPFTKICSEEFDGYEALGVLEGYEELERSNKPDTHLKKYTGTYAVDYKTHKMNIANSHEMIYNNEMILEDNILRGLSEHKAVNMEITNKKEIWILNWKVGEWNDRYFLYACK